MVRRSSSAMDQDMEMSPTGSEAPFNDRKKQTHLRCERQRREAINNGYSDLKELIPQTASAMGCKTTNASILFRACEYLQQLQKDVSDGETDILKLKQQLAALEMISLQYDTMAAETPTLSSVSSQAKMLQILLDDCFETFQQQVDFTSYATITRTLLTWVEQLAGTPEQFKRTAGKMVTLPYLQGPM